MASDRCLFIFRRDLRLTDNTALNRALETGLEVLPVFILDPRQLEDHPYRSTSGLEFMFNSLRELDDELRKLGSRLYLFEGVAEEVVGRLMKGAGLLQVFFNRDYTPFARNRDRRIEQAVRGAGGETHQYGDALLHEPEEVRSGAGTPYTVFTPFRKRCAQMEVRAPVALARGRFVQGEVPGALEIEALRRIWPRENPSLRVRGGRREALAVLKRIGGFTRYKEERDLPAIDGTTGLSASNKFGCLSVRELYHGVRAVHGAEHTLLSELHWRDFFTHIAFHFPHVFKGAFRPEYDRVAWHEHPERLAAWQKGLTGFPIVDAGMRELATTGFMHNRVRMIVASFLTKDLHISWREGERWFARNLVDYDPAVNNGNWQWASSSGCDAQPYFRIFNPWLQQTRFDPECEYIKRWVPELKALSPARLHKLADDAAAIPGYPRPIIDHAEEKLVTEELYAEALGR